jgi:GNAT superfamily N-acetyltransferase
VNTAYEVERFFVDGDRIAAAEVRELLGKGTFLLAEDGGTLIGSVYVEVRSDRGYFGLLSVQPARQGRGLGRRLVAAAEEYCRAAGCGAMDLLVVNLRTELEPFYSSLGYALTGTVPFPPDGRATRPCHFVVMSKRLDVS